MAENIQNGNLYDPEIGETIADASLSAEYISRLFSNEILRGSDKPPSRLACAKIAKAITSKRGDYRLSRSQIPGIPSTAKSISKWKNARRDIISSLSMIHDDFVSRNKILSSDPIWKFRSNEEMWFLDSWVEELDYTLDRIDHEIHEITNNDVIFLNETCNYLMDIFLISMKGSNPNKRYGLSENGPMVRFVYQANILIFGSSPSEGAIRQRLLKSRSVKGKNAGM